MSAHPMRITDDELLREVEALKSHRRLSVNRPFIDPDLPDLAATYGGGQELLSVPSPERERRGYSLVDDGAVPTRSPSGSSSTSLSPAKTLSNDRARFTARRRGQGADQSYDSQPGNASPTRLAPVSSSPSQDAFDSRGLATSPTSISSSSSLSPKDPSHLFWVPASVHPEISPTDFRDFIKEHAARAVSQHHGDADAAADDTLAPLAIGDSPIAHRLDSVRRQQQQRQTQSNDARDVLLGRSTSLSRRGSTLRRQYRPENDTEDTDEEKVPRPLQRNRSALSGRGSYGLAVPNLTIDDLQKLEAAAEEASQTQDPAMLRSVLRRTLSFNTTPDLDTVDAVPPAAIEEDPDAPIIVPKPGQILRRAARTKMRKASGDATRGSLALRRRAPRSSTDPDTGAPSEGSRAWELQQSEAEDMERRHSGQSELSSGADDDSSNGDSSSRPVSTEATDSIVDAYSRDSYQSDASQRTSVTSTADSTGSDSITPGASIGQAESESTSPPLTPTQDSFAPMPTYPAVDGSKRKIDSSRPVQQPAVRLVDPLETPRQESKVVGNNQIKPISVQHLPPVPSFEKTLPHQQQVRQQQQQTTRPSPASSSGSHTAAPALDPAITQGSYGQRRDAQAAPVVKPQPAPIVTQPQQRLPQQEAQPQIQSPPPATITSKHKDKERKGAFGLSWFGLGKDDEDDRGKGEKESQRKREKHEKRERKEREKEEREKEESSSSSFLGALFGKKKGHDEPSHHAAPRPAPNSQLTAGSLLERNEMAAYGKSGAYYYSRYPIHIERAVYRLSHIKLANPRRPLYEQVLISNLMFWYLSIINRSNQGQTGAQSQQMGQSQGNNGPQSAEQNGVNAAGQPSGGVNGHGSVNAAVVDTSSAYDGMEMSSSSSPESEDSSSSSAEQWSQNSTGGGGGGNGASLKQKRNGLVKPNRAPGGANRARTAETPMKQPGYGMQHRQIDDDLKTMGSHSGSLGSTGFVVGQVVDVKALQANTPYRFVPDPRSGDSHNYSDQAKSATTDYLGFGSQFGSSEPLWSNQNADAETAVEQKRGSSPNRPYRSEAEKERAWLGMRNNANNSGRASPTGTSHGYGSISQQSTEHELERRVPSRSNSESHPQGRSMSVGGIGAMSRTGEVWGSSQRPDRSRKTSMGHISPSASSQGLVSSMSSSSSGSSFGTIEEASVKGYGGMTTSSSAGALDGGYQNQLYDQQQQQQRSSAPSAGGQIDLPMAPGSSAMLDAARTSQSRRR